MNRKALAILAVLAACKDAQSRPGGAGGPGGGNMPPMPVEAVAALRDTVVESIEATGQIEAVQAVELRPEVDRLRDLTGEAFAGWTAFGVEEPRGEPPLRAPAA